MGFFLEVEERSQPPGFSITRLDLEKERPESIVEEEEQDCEGHPIKPQRKMVERLA